MVSSRCPCGNVNSSLWALENLLFENGLLVLYVSVVENIADIEA
jgi:hypothetical protein